MQPFHGREASVPLLDVLLAEPVVQVGLDRILRPMPQDEPQAALIAAGAEVVDGEGVAEGVRRDAPAGDAGAGGEALERALEPGVGQRPALFALEELGTGAAALQALVGREVFDNAWPDGDAPLARTLAPDALLASVDAAMEAQKVYRN